MAWISNESMFIDKQWLKFMKKRPYMLRLYFSWEAGNICLFLGCFGFNLSYNMMAPQYLGSRLTGYSIFWHPGEISPGACINAVDSSYRYYHDQQSIY